jgi:auxin efflux carrier family protein
VHAVFTDALFRFSPDKTLLPRSVAYISLYLLGWSPLFWVVGTTILGKENDNQSREEKRKVLLKRIFSPPVMASIVGLLVGSNKFLIDLFVPTNGIFHSVFESMRTLGAGYLPAVLLVLAGSLVGGPSTAPSTPQTTEQALTFKEKYANMKTSLGIKSGRSFFKQFSVVYLCRFLLMPTVAFAGLESLKWLMPALYQYLQSDPLLVFILLLEACMPSAQNSVTIMQLSGDKEGASMMARLLLVIYALGTPAITFWLMKIIRYTSIAIF